MAAIKGRYTHLVAGGTGQAWLFSGQSNSLEVSLSGQREEDTRFQDTAKTFITLEPEGNISQQGYFDDVTAGQFEREMGEAVINSEQWHVGAMYGTQTTACPIYIADTANISELVISSVASGLITTTGAWANNAGIKRGLRVYQGVVASGGGTTHIDLGGAGNTGFAYMWVYGNTGTMTGEVIQIQSDDNTGFTSPTVLGTFTLPTRGAYKVTIAGAIDRYIRLNTTSLGGGVTLTVVAAIVANGRTQGVA